MSKGNRYRGGAHVDYEHSPMCDDTYHDEDEPVHAPNADCVPVPVIGLGHQCDSWIIGTRADVQHLIDDLTQLLQRMETKS